MYFLNDMHNKYEYCVYCKVNGGSPYIGKIFNNIEQVFIFIEDKEKQHNRYHQAFYVDNDFYNNKYPLMIQNTYYYKILRRSLNDWEEFDLCNNSKNIDNSKIVDMSKYLSRNMA